MRRSAIEPVALATAAVICMAGSLLLAPGPVRGVLGGALVLILPGAALSALAGPALSGPDRLLAVLALSVAAAILGGIFLGATHIGFGARTWTLLTGGAAFAAALAALLVRRGSPAIEERPRYRCARSWLRRNAPTLACFLTAASLVVLALVLTHDSARHNAEQAARIANLAPGPARRGAR